MVAEYDDTDYAFVTDMECGLQIVDISKPALPELKKQINIQYYPTNDCRIQGTYAYFAASGVDTSGTEWHGCGWLQVVDLDEVMGKEAQYMVHSENPTEPYEYTRILCHINEDYVRGLDVEGDCAYLACDDIGIQIIDISDPSAVTDTSLTDSCDTPGNAYAVDVAGSYAYVADYDEGLQIIDVTPAWDGNPDTHPSIVGKYKTQNMARDIYLVYPYAYIADSYGGVAVIDVSDPADPTLFYSYSTPGSAYDVVVEGDYIYVADSDRGFHILDNSDSFINPAYLGSQKDNKPVGQAFDIDIVGDYAYIANLDSGLQIIDINPAHTDTYLEIVGNCITPGSLPPGNYWSTFQNYGYGVDVVDEYAF